MMCEFSEDTCVCLLRGLSRGLMKETCASIGDCEWCCFRGRGEKGETGLGSKSIGKSRCRSIFLAASGASARDNGWLNGSASRESPYFVGSSRINLIFVCYDF